MSYEVTDGQVRNARARRGQALVAALGAIETLRNAAKNHRAKRRWEQAAACEHEALRHLDVIRVQAIYIDCANRALGESP